MKTQKYMILGLALVLMALISPLSAKASVDTDLRYGSKGAEVTELQEFLIDKGFLTGSASGNFFTLTRKAVVAYQTSVQLPATGFVGPMTRGEINKELALGTSEEETQATPVVTTSPDVTALLAKLAELQAQMKAIQTSNETSQTQQNTNTAQTNQILGSIAQNTTPTPVVVTQPVIETPVDKSAIQVTYRGQSPFLGTDFPFGSYAFDVVVLDKNGKKVNAIVTTDITIPEQFKNRGLINTFSTGTRSNSFTEDWHGIFEYFPLESGSKTITFTSGNLSTSTTINVQ